MNIEDYKTEANDLREQLRDLLATLDGLASHAQTLADCLCDLHGDLEGAETTADLLAESEPVHATRPKIGPAHFRMLAVLNQYGPMARADVAKLVGISETTVGTYASAIRKHHLGDLVSRGGVYTLRAVGDGVTDSLHFKTN